jgi:hypothetical protein
MGNVRDILIASMAAATLLAACGDDGGGTSDPKDDAGTGGPPVGGTPAGGDPPPAGGTPVGGDPPPVGGTPVGGDPPPVGGMPMGGDPPPVGGTPPTEPPPPACDNPPCAWPASDEWGPSGRVNYINIPANEGEAATAGCDLIGEKNGTALGALVSLAGGTGLADFVLPDDQGEIQLLLLGRLAGADEGEAFGETGPIDFQLFTGDQDGIGGYTIDPASFVEGTTDPLIHFENTQIAADGAVSTEASRFSLSLPLVEGLPLAITLDATKLSGYVALGSGGVGFQMSNGIIQGYLSKSAIIDLIIGIQAVCAGMDPPSLCDTVGGIIGGPGSCTQENCPSLGLILGLVGSFEAKVTADGMPGECDPGTPDDCNAIGVCLQAEMEGITIAGVTPPQ